MLQKVVDRLVHILQRMPFLLSKKLRAFSPTAADAVAKVDIDSPIILSFAGLCVTVHVTGSVIPNLACLPMNHFQFLNISHWCRLFTHVLMHGSREHLMGNMVNVLLVGPACERSFGSFALLKIILWTASASGAAHVLFSRASHYGLGASGIVFMLILLNSLLSARAGRVPLTFIIQVVLWCWQEVVSQFQCSMGTRCDGISHIAHLSGALVGTAAGFYFHGGSPRQPVCAWAGQKLQRLFGAVRSIAKKAA